ncbi:unnamed protein product, partial [Brassica napus]
LQLIGSHINHKIFRCTKKTKKTTRSPRSNPGPPSTAAPPPGSPTVSVSSETSKKRYPTYSTSLSRKSLRNRPVFFENLLRFVDAYGIFRTSVLSLREHQSAAQVALRRKDDVKISSYVKSRRALARDVAKLTSSIYEPKTKYNHCHVDVLNGSYGEAELASVIGGDIEVTVLVSVALFNGIYLSLRSSKTMAFVGFLKRSVREERQEL